MWILQTSLNSLDFINTATPSQSTFVMNLNNSDLQNADTELQYTMAQISYFTEYAFQTFEPFRCGKRGYYELEYTFRLFKLSIQILTILYMERQKSTVVFTHLLCFYDTNTGMEANVYMEHGGYLPSSLNHVLCG